MDPTQTNLTTIPNPPTYTHDRDDPESAADSAKTPSIPVDCSSSAIHTMPHTSRTNVVKCSTSTLTVPRLLKKAEFFCITGGGNVLGKYA
jgi:hypothetical protein